MTRAALLIASLALIVWSCDGNSTGPATLAGTYTLVAENDVPLPSDHGEPEGCCLTLSGSLTLTATTYDLLRGRIPPFFTDVTAAPAAAAPGQPAVRAAGERHRMADRRGQPQAR